MKYLTLTLSLVILLVIAACVAPAPEPQVQVIEVERDTGSGDIDVNGLRFMEIQHFGLPHNLDRQVSVYTTDIEAGENDITCILIIADNNMEDLDVELTCPEVKPQ